VSAQRECFWLFALLYLFTFVLFLWASYYRSHSRSNRTTNTKSNRSSNTQAEPQRAIPTVCRGRPAGRPNLPGERPVRLSGFRLAARASTLFPPLRPGRAGLGNSPACAPGKAGPTRFLRLCDASARDFVPSSAASARNQVGPVSPDAHASGAAGCCAPWFRPGRAAPGQNGKIWPGGHFSSPPSWARVASVQLFTPSSPAVYQSG
jgi:hypothetical protein